MISFYSSNLVDQSSISASTENALFPFSNLQDPRRTKVFRSTTNADSIVFDFGETSEVNSVLLVDSPRDGFGVITATLELNGTDSWGAPAYSTSITLNAVHGLGFKEFTTQNYRFARIVLTSTLGYCELAKIFIGKEITFTNNMGIDLGWTYQDKELSTVKENRYGQKFVDVIARQKQFAFSIRSMDKTELDQMLEIYDEKGSTKPFFVRIGDNSMINDSDRFSGMVYLTAIPQITNKSFGLYDMSMNLEEAM
jgi:hypothetical protein